jgi:glycosyltransferase involved in cell wall biosynthesis
MIVGLATFDEMPGGSGRYVTGLQKALVDRGHHVRVVTAASLIPPPLTRLGGLTGQVVRTAFRFLVVAPHMAASVLRHRPEVLNVHFPLDGLAPALAARVVGSKVVVTFHGPWAAEADARSVHPSRRSIYLLRWSIERAVYLLGARFIVLSDAFGQILQREYGVPADRIDTIPGGIHSVDEQNVPSRQEARSRFAVDENGSVVVAVRRLVPRVGLDLALEALAMFPATRRPLLLIAGTGPERESLERLSVSLGVREWVRFTGFIPDESLTAFYATGNVCVVPSRSLEGFGYGALEALAAGVPVIATDVGGLSEVVGSLEPRWVTEPTARAIQVTLDSVLQEPNRFPDAAACREYSRRFEWARVVGKVEECFRKAATVRSRPKPF